MSLLSLIGLSNLETRYATLSNQLTKRIGTGQYRVGEYLPSEKQLAHEFGVSRPTVRRALEYVEALGLISRQAWRWHQGARKQAIHRLSLYHPAR